MVPDKGGAFSTRRGPRGGGTRGHLPTHTFPGNSLTPVPSSVQNSPQTTYLVSPTPRPQRGLRLRPPAERWRGPSPAPIPCQGPVRGRHPLLLTDLPPPFRICETLLPKCLSPSPEHPPALTGLPTPSPLGAFENKPSRAACPLRFPTGPLRPREAPGPGLPAPAADGSRASPSCTLRHLDPCSTEPVPTSPPRSFGAEQVRGGGAEGTGLGPAPHAP